MDVLESVSVEPKEERPEVALEDAEEARSTPSVIEEEKEIGDMTPSTPGPKDKHEEEDDDDEESGLEEQPPSPKKSAEIEEKQDSPKKPENAEQPDEKKVNQATNILLT